MNMRRHAPCYGRPVHGLDSHVSRLVSYARSDCCSPRVIVVLGNFGGGQGPIDLPAK
jgi:hypothetical protein